MKNMCNLAYYDFIYFSGKGNGVVIQSTLLPKPDQGKVLLGCLLFGWRQVFKTGTTLVNTMKYMKLYGFVKVLTFKNSNTT